ERLSRHSSRLKREYRATLEDLQKLQEKRQQREKTDLKEAAQIAKFCQMNKEPFNPSDFGFVLHTHQVDGYIHRTFYLDQAKIAARYDFDQERYLAAVRS